MEAKCITEVKSVKRFLIIFACYCCANFAQASDYGKYRAEAFYGYEQPGATYGLDLEKDLSGNKHYAGLVIAAGSGKFDDDWPNDDRAVVTQMYRLGVAYSYFPFQNYNIVLRVSEHLAWMKGVTKGSKRDIGTLYGPMTMVSIGQRGTVYDLILGIEIGIGLNHMTSDVTADEDLLSAPAVRDFNGFRDDMTVLLSGMVGWKWD